MRYIIALLLITGTLSAQTKWRQIERSLTKWNVPAAYDSIPGQTGYASKYISLVALLDSINYTVGDLNGTGEADQVTYWKSTDSLTGSNSLKWQTNNYLNIVGRIGLQATSTAGNWNAFINGGNTNVTGEGNVAMGSNQTLSSVTSGNNNVAFGRLSGNKITTGSNNMLIGYLTGTEITTGERNTFVGSSSGYLNTGSDNTYIGDSAGRNGTNNSNSTYIGSNSGYNATNSNNVSIGFYSSFNTTNTGQYNTVIGNAASQNGGGNNSVKIGTLSGYGNTGSNNVFLGYESGYATSAKGGNVFIGYQSGRNEDIDNSLIIANSNSTTNGIYGDFDTNKFGINIAPASITRTFDINGELRVRDLTTDAPTLLIGADSDGDVASVTVGNGLTLASSTLRADTSVLATQYDLLVIDGGGPDSTIVAAGWGIDVTESPLNTFTVKADTAEVATQYDLTLKQDKLVSGTNIKTVNSNSLLGSGNVSVGTVTSIATSAPISGGTITGSGTIGLNYDAISMGLTGSNLYAKYNEAIWNASSLKGTSLSTPFSPSTNQVLTYNGSAWAPATPSAGTTNLTMTGSASPFTLNSDTGTDVTFAAGTGIALTRSSNELTIESTLTAPQTWGDFTTNIQSWGSTGSFGSGKDVGIGGQPSKDFDVIGDARLRGAIYNSSNSAGSSGQVLTSQGTSAWTWATPADGSATNEAQTLSLGSNGAISLSAISGVGGGTATIPQATYGTLYNTGNLSQITLDGTERELTFTEGQGNNTTVSTANESITILTAGTYRIEYNGSYQTQSPHVVSPYFLTYKNGSDIGYVGECRTRNTENGLNNMTTFSRSFITDLAVNDVIELYYKKVTGTDTTFSVFNLNLMVQRIN